MMALVCAFPHAYDGFLEYHIHAGHCYRRNMLSFIRTLPSELLSSMFDGRVHDLRPVLHFPPEMCNGSHGHGNWIPMNKNSHHCHWRGDPESHEGPSVVSMSWNMAPVWTFATWEIPSPTIWRPCSSALVWFYSHLFPFSKQPLPFLNFPFTAPHWDASCFTPLLLKTHCFRFAASHTR